jgi:hypothetical protein
MPETARQLVQDILTEGSFDASEAQALRWLDRRHKRMVARSRCYRGSHSVTWPSGAGALVPFFTLPTDVTEVISLTVDGVMWMAGRPGDRSATVTDGGVFVPVASSQGQFGGYRLELNPVPEPGQFVQAEVVRMPPGLTIDGVLQVDADFFDDLVAGALATALARPNEARPDLARAYEQQFADGCEELRRRVNRRYRGAGPARIRVEF